MIIDENVINAVIVREIEKFELAAWLTDETTNKNHLLEVCANIVGMLELGNELKKKLKETKNEV